jgi:V/A-type H+-transporting ATPase subunit A
MAYLQQDAFDKVDASAPLDRQKKTFDLIDDVLNRRYNFPDKAGIRDYFTQLTGLFKNLNYSPDGSFLYNEYLTKILELAKSQTK